MNYLYDAANAVNKASRKIGQAGSDVYTSLTTKKDKYKNLMEMVIDYDYPIEKHFYTTKDGYINCVFRISGPRGTSAINNA